MFVEGKSDRASTASLHVLSHLPILPLEEQQRLTVPHHNVLDLSNKDSMVPGNLRRVQAALQVRQRSVQNRSPMLGAFKASPGLSLSILVRALRPRIIF